MQWAFFISFHTSGMENVKVMMKQTQIASCDEADNNVLIMEQQALDNTWSEVG